MKSVSLWTRNFQSIVDNGRNHHVIIDLPETKEGNNTGATALELCVMGFSGCVGTIFAVVAKKMRLSFDEMRVEIDAEQKYEAPTITDIHFNLIIKTLADKTKVEKCLELTMNTCPVGILFKQAGVNISHEIIMM